MPQDIDPIQIFYFSVQKDLDDARTFLNQGALQEAAAILELLVEVCPDCTPAWVLLGRLALSIPDVPGALDFFGHALAQRPEDPEILAWLGDAQRRGGLIDEAQASLRNALALVPDNLIVACKLANSYVDSGELFQAKELLTEVLDRFPGVPELYLLRGLTFRQMGNDAGAEVDLRVCLGLIPETAVALAVLGDICREQHKLDEAAIYIEKAYRLAPEDVEALRAKGNLSISRKDWKEAAFFYQKVLKYSPDDVIVALNRAAALVEMGDALGAIDALEACLAVGATEQWVYEMTGLIFAHRGQWQVAVDSLEIAVEKEPRNINAWNTLIVAYNKLGLMAKSEMAAHKALEIEPRHVSALINLAGWYIDLGRHDEGVETFLRALEVDPSNSVAYTGLMFGMLFSSQPKGVDLLDMGRRFDSNVAQSLRKIYSFNLRNKEADRVLRIGWVSSDLRAHPVGAFVAPFFPFLDKEKVENYVYDNWPTEDSVTATIKPAVTVWRSVRGLGDNALAECIRADEIDILVDLNGHTAGHRLGVFARKPAPIQVEWLGFPGTSGMSAMDYVFVPDDDYLQQGKWCAEKPWALPNCYGVRGNIPEVHVRENLPCDVNGYFTFACMNRYSKVSAAALDLWANILQRTGNSKLLLIGRGGNDEQTLFDLRGRFAAKGVAEDRLLILNSLPVLEYFDTYNRADICLDPFPFNGGTTGFDSIWMGVPFITLRGDALHSRAGANILKYVGLSDLVAETEAEYVEKAVALSLDLPALRRYRLGLRQRMQESPLLNCGGFAKGMENAFRKMWKIWCLNEDSAK